MPLFTVVAGPNGSGKSTLVNFLSFEGKENLLNPDIVAAELSAGDVQKAAISAARIVLTLTQRFLDDRQSFAIETTLSSKKIIQTFSLARDLGFALNLVYVSLDTPERNISRVQIRVAGVDTMSPMKMCADATHAALPQLLRSLSW